MVESQGFGVRLIIGGSGVSLPTVDLSYGALALGILGVIFGIWGMTAAASVRRRYLKVFGEDRPERVEDLVATLHQRVDTAVDRFDGYATRLDALEFKAGQSINRVGLVRFNPFMDTGSDLSFSAALLNDHGDGLVLTSLWGRDEVRLYAKPIETHESRYVLSQEEKQALDMAKNARATKKAVESKA